MRCILEGHKPARVEGQGERRDRVLVLCIECGGVLQDPTGGFHAAAQSQPQEQRR